MFCEPKKFIIFLAFCNEKRGYMSVHMNDMEIINIEPGVSFAFVNDKETIKSIKALEYDENEVKKVAEAQDPNVDAWFDFVVVDYQWTTGIDFGTHFGGGYILSIDTMSSYLSDSDTLIDARVEWGTTDFIEKILHGNKTDIEKFQDKKFISQKLFEAMNTGVKYVKSL